jgi:regulator of nucleoside diphosphate kinase
LKFFANHNLNENAFILCEHGCAIIADALFDHGRKLMSTLNEPAVEMRAKPRIILSADDYERLSALAQAARGRMPTLAAELADELGRAHVLHEGVRPQHIVRMNSQVEFRDETTGKVNKVRLVYPADADIAAGKISVLTPVGTALIGVCAGDSISWDAPGGERRKLTVLSVEDSIRKS